MQGTKSARLKKGNNKGAPRNVPATAKKRKKTARKTVRSQGGGLESLAAPSNRAILDQAIGAHWPGTRKLNPPFDPMSRAGLAAKIRALGVPVQTAPVQTCTTVQCVLDVMKSVNPGGG
jgi:hypothetical protein